jgi:hypothetical protein
MIFNASIPPGLKAMEKAMQLLTQAKNQIVRPQDTSVATATQDTTNQTVRTRRAVLDAVWKVSALQPFGLNSLGEVGGGGWGGGC